MQLFSIAAIGVLILQLDATFGQKREPPPRAPVFEKYNLNRLPWDVRPAWYMVGVWESNQPEGRVNPHQLPLADTLDFGIGILPMFGARSLNYTGTIVDNQGKTLFTENGYMLVKNQSRFDPTIRSAFLTVSDWGYTTLEEGDVRGNTISFQMMTFAQRSFNVLNNYRVSFFRRTFIFRPNSLTQTLDYEVNGQSHLITKGYHKVGGWNCFEGCQFVQRKRLFDACRLC